jgi:hypothetical protein
VVFHGFPSEGEAQAYWNGAGFPDVCFTLKQRRQEQTQHVPRTPLSPPPTLLTSGVALLRTPFAHRSRVVTCCANPFVDVDCLQATGAMTSTSLACTACEAMP